LRITVRFGRAEDGIHELGGEAGDIVCRPLDSQLSELLPILDKREQDAHLRPAYRAVDTTEEPVKESYFKNRTA